MRTRTRLATTAGLTVLGCTAMSGVAQAGTGGLDLSAGLTDPVTKTVTKTVTDALPRTSTRRSGDSGVGLDLPVRVRLGGSSAGTGGTRGGASAGARASLKASPEGVRAKASVRLCTGGCGEPNPAPQPPPTPPAPPSPAPPGSTPPVALPPLPPSGGLPADTGQIVVAKRLPYTGGPVGTLAFLGAIAVVAGAAAVICARPKARIGA